jgi:subfamily B ATP-binding cassette protein MsbA
MIAAVGKAVRRRSKRSLEYMAGLMSILHETIGGVRVVKMFNMNDKENIKFKEENQRFTHHSYKSTSVGAISSPLTESLEYCGGNSSVVRRREVLPQAISSRGFCEILIFLSRIYPLKSLGAINSHSERFAAAKRVLMVRKFEEKSLFKTENYPLFPLITCKIRILIRKEKTCLHNVCFNMIRAQLSLWRFIGAGKIPSDLLQDFTKSTWMYHY